MPLLETLQQSLTNYFANVWDGVPAKIRVGMSTILSELDLVVTTVGQVGLRIGISSTDAAKTGKLKPEDWRCGTDVLQVIKDQQAGNAVALTEPILKDGEVELWLVDFIMPFGTPENKLAQACMADLMAGPLKGKRLKMHKTDPGTGDKSVVELGGE